MVELTGVEVGVDRGTFSQHLLQHWNGRMLHLVDPWLAGGVYSPERTADVELTLSLVSAFPGRYQMHRGFSTMVALVRFGGFNSSTIAIMITLS